jgi:hypothetical protein
MQDFLNDINDYMMSRSGSGISDLEWIVRYVFSASTRSDVVFAVNRMLQVGPDEDIQEAFNSNLPKALSLALDVE